MNKKLVIFSYDFPPSNGGIARLCQEIAVGQQEYFQEVIVLTRTIIGESKPYNFDKVKIVELPSKRGFCELKAYQFLNKIEKKEEYKILCGLWHPEAIISISAGFKNVFVLGHGTEFLSGTSKFRRFFWLPFYAKWVLGKAKCIVANSDYTKKLIEKVNQKANVEALPLAVNEAFFKPKESKTFTEGVLRIVTVSRILQFKGYDLIAKTIANLPEEYKRSIQWNIGGTGPYLQSLKELVKDLGVEKNVSFHGFIPDEDLPCFYNSNDIFVLCTRQQENSTAVEGFGLVFLEAQSCGIPVIGTNSGGIPSAVKHEDGGWLIKQDDENELSELLKKVIDNKGLIKEQGLKARKRVEKYCTWEKYNEKLIKILDC